MESTASCEMGLITELWAEADLLSPHGLGPTSPSGWRDEAKTYGPTEQTRTGSCRPAPSLAEHWSLFFPNLATSHIPLALGLGK